ncbi:MAG: STAS domain-containing protein [Steroidobacteraceae bacterium]
MNKRKQGAAPRATRRGRTVRSTSAAGTEHKGGNATFAVAAECTVADASSLQTGLAKLLDESGSVTLDISAVQRIDTAGLQVIATFVRERESHGRQVQWRGSAPAVSSAAGLLGLSALLKLPASAEQAVESAA